MQDEEDPDMDILKQCQKWHEKDKHQKIIDALEAIPAEERTPEMDMRAGPGLQQSGGLPASRRAESCFEKALELMKPHEEDTGRHLFLEFPHGVCLLLSGSGGPRSAVF